MQRSVEQVGRIADSQSQEIIETLMQDNSAADTSDDNKCDEITNATIGAVRSSVQMIVRMAQDDHKVDNKLFLKALQYCRRGYDLENIGNCL